MSVFLLDVSRIFSGHFKIHLRRFARENLLIVERRFDLAVYKEDYFVVRDWQVAHSVLSVHVCANDLLQPAAIFGLDMHFSARDRL